MADDQQKNRPAGDYHWVRDAFLTAIIAGHSAATPITATRTQTNDSPLAQSSSQTAAQPADRDQAEYAEARRIRQEQEQDRALDLGRIVHAPVQVEERTHDRDER